MSTESASHAGGPADGPLRVVVFSGGRGANALLRQLVHRRATSITVAINGYDDGLSTGELRRFLGDSLGPSDFRKNASRLAVEMGTCPAALVEFLDHRLPHDCTEEDAIGAFAAVAGDRADDRLGLSAIAASLGRETRLRIAAALNRFVQLISARPDPFSFADCSVGNLVFAGLYLGLGRNFNQTIDAYADLVGLPAGTIENVTDGRNAWLVAVDADGRLLPTEAAIVNAAQPSRIRDIHLIDRPLTPDERTEAKDETLRATLDARRATVVLNPRLAERLAEAQLIVYAPGTQHSSLFPSYLTPGLSAAIASNLRAIKLLITNIQPDAESTGSSAVDLVDRAVHYLKNKGQDTTPTPCLITHYLLNEPARGDDASAYVPLGPIDAIEDPRVVRIGNYEDGVTGRHAPRVLAPFIESIVRRDTRARVAVLLHDAGSANKVAETLLEMVRGGIERVPVDITAFYGSADRLSPGLAERLPFPAVHLAEGDGSFVRAASGERFDFVILFESSGMYRGEDVVSMASHLAVGRLDAVWGSRRLSVHDIEETYRFRYRRNVVLGATSFLGSHALSLAYLMLYGLYISDTLSGVRAVPAMEVLDSGIDLASASVNHWLLSGLLRRKAEILEVPVYFCPLSPERVKRTSPWQGLVALATIVRRRFTPTRRRRDAAPAASMSGATSDR